MNAREQLQAFLKLLSRHWVLLVDAYFNKDVIDEGTNPAAVNLLLSARLLRRRSAGESLRLVREMSALFGRVLQDRRRVALDPNIGSIKNRLEDNISSYKESVHRGFADDAEYYLGQIENLVGDLIDGLQASSEQFWHKINSDFGYVSSLEAKVRENDKALFDAHALNNMLGLLTGEFMTEMAGDDPVLQRQLEGDLLAAVVRCGKETVDAIHKLKSLLFQFREKQKLDHYINTYYQHCQNNPGYEPRDYTVGEVPEVFNKVIAMPIEGHADITDLHQEVVLTGWIVGLRKALVVDEKPVPVPDVAVLPTMPSIEQPLPALAAAVETFFLRVLNSAEPISAVSCRPAEDVAPDVNIWLYALVLRHDNMNEQERRIFGMEAARTVDPVFNGLHYVSDIQVRADLSQAV